MVVHIIAKFAVAAYVFAWLALPVYLAFFYALVKHRKSIELKQSFFKLLTSLAIADLISFVVYFVRFTVAYVPFVSELIGDWYIRNAWTCPVFYYLVTVTLSWTVGHLLAIAVNRMHATVYSTKYQAVTLS